MIYNSGDNKYPNHAYSYDQNTLIDGAVSTATYRGQGGGSGGDVTVKYVDEEGNPLSDDVIIKGDIGDDYTTEQKAIDGYTLKEVQGDTTGQYTEATYTIIYIYTKNNDSNPVPEEPGAPTLPEKPTSALPNTLPSTVVDPVVSKITPIEPLINSSTSRNIVEQLPETGNDKKASTLLTFIGLLISSFMGFGLVLKKYKGKKEKRQ